jgi:hypothetical protein
LVGYADPSALKDASTSFAGRLATSDIQLASASTLAAADVTEAFRQSTSTVHFSNAADINGYFQTVTGYDFIDWFNRVVAGRGAWAGKSIAAPVGVDVLKRRFIDFWDDMPIVFGAGQIGLIQFVSLMSVAVHDRNGDLVSQTEFSGRPGHPGLAYFFDSIPGVKGSYNVGPLNKTAGTCFRDTDFRQAHGSLALGNGQLAGTTDPVWDGTIYPQGMVSTAESLQFTGFVTQADFYKFRGRGIIQTTWRTSYATLVSFIQSYVCGNQVVLDRKADWAGLGRDIVLTCSTNAVGDDLFAELELAWNAIRLFGLSKGDFLTMNLTAADLNGKGPGSIYNVGLQMNGAPYAATLRSRVMQILNGLGNGTTSLPGGGVTL